MKYTNYQEIREVLLLNEQINSNDLKKVIQNAIDTGITKEELISKESINKMAYGQGTVLFKVESENDVLLIQNHLKTLNPTDLVDELLLLMDTIEIEVGSLAIKIFDGYHELLKVYEENRRR